MTGFVQARPYDTGQSALGTMQDIEQTRQLQQRSALGDLQMQMEQLKAQRAAEQYRIQQEMLKTLTPEQRLAFSYAPEQTGQALAKRLYPDYVNVGRQGSVYDPQQNKVVYQSPDIEGVQWQGAPGSNLAGARPPAVPQPQSSQTFAPGATGAPAPLTGGAKPPAASIPPQYRDQITAHATRNGLPVEIVGNLIKQESNFNPAARNRKSGAAGMTQVLPSTGKDPGFGVTPMRDNSPEEQIRFGSDYLGALVRYYQGKGKDPESALNLALGAYNWGFDNVDTWLEKTGGDLSKVPAETLGFVQAIIGPMRGGGGASPAQTAGAPQPNGQASDRPPAGGSPTPAPAQTSSGGEWETALKGGAPYTQGAKPGTFWQRRQIGVDAQGRPKYEYRTAPGGDGKEPMFGKTEDALAIQHLVESGILTPDQGAAWLAARQVTGPNGQVDLVTPGLNVTSVRPPQLSPQDKEAITEADRKVEAGAAVIGTLNRALELNDQAFSGPTAEARAFGDRLVPGEWGGTATTEFQNLVLTQALESLKSIFGAAPTEGERKILVDLQASIDKTPKERAIILNNAKVMAQRRMDRERERAKSLRGGTYYKEGLPEPTVPNLGGAGDRTILRFDEQGNPIQ